VTKLIAPECQCRYSTSLGEKKPEVCKEHGNRFVLASSVEIARHPASLGRNPYRKSLKRSEPRRDWTLANAKREEEGDLCRVTGEAGTELAHILGRKYDEPISPGSKTLLVLPDRVVPLAPRIHSAYDRKEFDLLPYLTAAEQAQAVLDAGSMGLALKRISPMLEMAA